MADAGSTDPRSRRSNAGHGAAYSNAEESHEWATQAETNGAGLLTPRVGSNGEDYASRFEAGGEFVVDTSNTRINDDNFMQDLGRLKELRSFLIQEAVPVRTADAGALEFGRLNL